MLAVTLSAGAPPQLCFDQAGRDYRIDPLLLMVISIQESRLKPQATNKSSAGGTQDFCAMQVNSSNFKKLEKFNIKRNDLMNDPCICVYTGAWVLARNFQDYGRNWNSVGIYNAGPSQKNMKARKEYMSIIKSIYRVLLARKEILNQQPRLEGDIDNAGKLTDTASLNKVY
ncbi:lytic transglycosylase domain-containing protein [Enterobacter ludwigii]